MHGPWDLLGPLTLTLEVSYVLPRGNGMAYPP